MRKEDLKKSFDNLNPSELSTKKMLNKILNHSDDKSKSSFLKSFNFRKAIPALALVLIAGSLLTYSLIPKNGDNPLLPRVAIADVAELGRDDIGIMPLLNQFQMDNKHYILMSDEQIAEFKLSKIVKQSDIGEKLTTITTSIDKSLKGSDVYRYIPTGGEAIVVVKKDNKYKLFSFFAFESYNNNQDEDVSAYLKLYGINRAADIAKVQFIARTEQAKVKGVLDIKGEIAETAKIKEFYDFYSIIKNSSDKYFKKLFNEKTKVNPSPPESKEIPPDYVAPAVDLPANTSTTDKPEHAVDTSKENPSSNVEEPVKVDEGKSGQSTEPSQGNVGDALFNSVTIRIYNQSGIYFDAEYYPNIGFISRHEVNDAFAKFLKDYIGK